MINPSSERCKTFHLQMDAIEFLRTAPPLPRSLLEMIDKVIRVVMIPLALIVDFAINGVRIAANLCISVVNWVRGPPRISPFPKPSPMTAQAPIEKVQDDEPKDLSTHHLEREYVEEMPIAPTTDPNSASSRELSVNLDEPEVIVLPEPSHTPPTSSSPSISRVGSNSASLSSTSSPSITDSVHSTAAHSINRTSPSVITQATLVPECTPEQAALIHELLQLINTNNLMTLKSHPRPKEIGLLIRDVHPLTFFVVAVSENTTKRHLHTIFNDFVGIKKTGFMTQSNGEGAPSLKDSLTNKAKSGELAHYLDDFIQKTNADPTKARALVRKHSWSELILHIASR